MVGESGCPLRGSLQEARARRERHDCIFFKPLSAQQILNRTKRAVKREAKKSQGVLF